MFALYTRQRDQPKTFDNQKSLPRLPIPTLSDSLQNYVKSLKPLLYEEARLSSHRDPEAFVTAEIEKREALARDFSNADGLGRKLQERLLDIERTSPTNWLDDNFWTRLAYLSWRVSLPVNSNWWINCAHDPDAPRAMTDSRPPDGEFTNWQVRRAAVLAWRLLDFKDRLDREELIPDSSRAGAFCMYQYTRVFGVTRIPGIPEDRVIVPPFPNPNTHITVIIRDQVFTLNTRDDKGNLKPKDAIEAALWLMIYDVNQKDGKPSPAVGVLTGHDRDSWTEAREHLLTLAEKNRSNLNAIEDSLFVVALDDYTRVHPDPHASSQASELAPLSDEAARDDLDPTLDLDSHISNSCAGMNGHNRWFDKVICVSVESNSRASVVGEHSPCDALIPGIIADYMLAEGMGKPKGPLKRTLVAHHDATGSKSDAEDKITLEDLDIERLEWTTDNKIERAIEQAEATIKAIVEDSDGLMLWYDEYGADWMKRQAKLSPDAYIQMAMQLAYRRMHGKGTPTYETASTRLFHHGRTETIRTFSEDSQRWVETVVSGKANEEELYNLLFKAVQAHNHFTREASVGKGFDRHLLGLRQVLREGETHELFKDPLFAESQSFKLSTSGLSAGDRFFGTGFGAPEKDGYGINYLAGADIIKFGMESKRSSKETSTHAFRLAIIEALREMRRICEVGRPKDKDNTSKL